MVKEDDQRAKLGEIGLLRTAIAVLLVVLLAQSLAIVALCTRPWGLSDDFLISQSVSSSQISSATPSECQPCQASPAGIGASAASLVSPQDEILRDTCYLGGIFQEKSGAKKAEISGKLKAVTGGHMYGLDQRMLPPTFVPFYKLLCNSTDDKQIHYYGHMYSEYLDPLRLEQIEVNLLEIGLREGDSVNLWMAAFPSGKIYGLDPFYSNPMQHLSPEDRKKQRLHVFKGDQENVTDLNTVISVVQEEVGLLDIIIDDGGHTMGQQLTSFRNLFSLVKPGGVYFIEDLQTSYWEKKCHVYYNGKPYCYGGGPPGKKGTTIDHIKSLVDVMNSDFMEDHEAIGAIGSGKYLVDPVDALVGSVQCWRNMCAIRRKFEGSYF